MDGDDGLYTGFVKNRIVPGDTNLSFSHRMG